MIEDTAWLRQQIDDLTALQEGRSSPWSVNDAPPDYIRAQLKGIIGVEIPISRIEGKWKVSQNLAENDRAGVVEGLRGEKHGELMAGMVAKRSIGVVRDK